MKDKKIIIILILVIVLIAIIIMYNLSNSSVNNSNIWESIQQSSDEETTTILKSNSEIKSASIETIETHAGYYLSEVYVEENQFVEEGENILQYTNGEYLTAPYDCYVTELELPSIDGKCLNSHYIQIEGKNILTVTMNIDEEQIDQITIGKEVQIEVSAIDTTYVGYVTHIASTAKNGKFEVDIEFENDGNIKLGMTSTVTMEL